jgi:hypothetical protein
MDESYYEADYIDFHYYNYIARADSSMRAFDIITCAVRVIHIMAALTYKIHEETRLYRIREETRLKKVKI